MSNKSGTQRSTIAVPLYTDLYLTQLIWMFRRWDRNVETYDWEKIDASDGRFVLSPAAAPVTYTTSQIERRECRIQHDTFISDANSFSHQAAIAPDDLDVFKHEYHSTERNIYKKKERKK